MDKIVNFPQPTIELNDEEYKKYLEYQQKMVDAKSKAEMNYYYNQVKILIRKAKEREE